LSVFSKILEKLMYNKLIFFVTKADISAEARNGFRQKKSTKTAIQSFIESIQKAIERSIHAIGIFFDLTKACDLINHYILLDKLNSYGIRGKTNICFKSYLAH
jgi:retron-type reverse transcriptase